MRPSDNPGTLLNNAADSRGLEAEAVGVTRKPPHEITFARVGRRISARMRFAQPDSRMSSFTVLLAVK
jgi:hypothetical protein